MDGHTSKQAGRGRVRPALLVTAVALLTAFAGACGDDDEAAPAGQDGGGSAAAEELTVAVIVPQPGNAFYAPLQAGAEAAGKDLKVEILYQGPPDGDPVKQNAMIEAAVQRQVDGIVLASGSADAAIQSVNTAVDAGIPVATTSADTPDSKRDFYFGEDGPAGGELLAQAVAHTLEKGASPSNVKVAIGSCLPGAQIQQVRIRAFKKELKEHVNYSVETEFNSSLDDVKNKQTWETVVSANPDVDVFFGGCAIDTRHAGLALKDGDRRGAIAFGYDLLPDTLRLINEDWVKFALGESPYRQGYEPVKAIVDHLRDDKPLPSGFVPVQMELATADESLSQVTEPYGEDVVKLWTDVDGLLKRESPYYE